MLKGRWYELRVIAAGGRLRLRQTALQRTWGMADSGEAETTGSLGALAKLTIGAASTTAAGPYDNPYCAFFNGRVEDPAILIGARERPQPLEPDKAECLAWWDFSAEIPTERIIDRGPHGLHGHVRNLPTRGAWLTLDRRGDQLAACAPPLRRYPFPSGRSLRLWLGNRFCLRHSRRYDVRGLRHPPTL
jgi:hypothetical protein